MNIASIGGPPDSKEFMIAVHVAVLAKKKYPPFHFRTTPVKREHFQAWRECICEEEQWEEHALKDEVLICWYEIGSPGGPKVLIGGLFAFLEYMKASYGVNREISLAEVEEMVQCKKQEMEILANYKKLMGDLKNKLVFSIVGAGNNRAVSSLIYSLLRLKGLKIHDGIIIRLFDRFEENWEKLEDIRKKFNIFENRMGYGFVKIVKTFHEAVKNCDVLIFLGEYFRKEGMDVEKHLYKERVLYGVYGVLCNKYLSRRTKVVFLSMENPCFNANSFRDRAVSVNIHKLAVPTSYIASEIRTYISQVAGFPLESIMNIPVWGFVDVSHLVDVGRGKVMFRYPDKKDIPNFESLMEKSSTGMKLFIKLMMIKKAERDAVEELNETERYMREKLDKALEKDIALKKKVDYALRIQKYADEGSDYAKIMLRNVWEEISFMVQEGRREEHLFNLEDLANRMCYENLMKNEDENGDTKSKEDEGGLCEDRLPSDWLDKLLREEMNAFDDDGEDIPPPPEMENLITMRNLEYITSSLRNMWHFIGVAKNTVRKKTGQDPFISQVRELEDLLQIWLLDPLRNKEVIWLGVASDGTYGLPEGIVLSQPATLNAELEWKVYTKGEHLFPERMPQMPHPAPLEPESLPPPGPYSLSAVVAKARMCLKHFLIAPETETIEDFLQKRYDDMEYINWRLENLQATYEYEELGKMEEEKDKFEEEIMKRMGSPRLCGERLGEGQFGRPPPFPEAKGEGGEGASTTEQKPSLLEILEGEEETPGPQRDEIHTKYLRDLGFYNDETTDGKPLLGKEYDEKIKKAFMEFYLDEDLCEKVKEQEEEEAQVEEEKVDYYSDRGFSYEGIGMRAEDEELERFPIEESDKLPSFDVLPVRHGMGAALDIEDDFNPEQIMTNPVIMASKENYPKIDEKHEYEKPYTSKPGFPLNLQGKSTTDAFKMFLDMDPKFIKEKFLELAKRVDEEYEEELSRGNIVEEEDGNITITETVEEEEDSAPMKQTYAKEKEEEGSLAFLKDPYVAEEICAEVAAEEKVEESIGSFSTFTNETSQDTSGVRTPSFTIKEDPSCKMAKKEEWCLDLWTKSEVQESETDIFVELSAVEKMAFQGALRIQGESPWEEEDKQAVEEKKKAHPYTAIIRKFMKNRPGFRELCGEEEDECERREKRVDRKELMAAYCKEIKNKEYHYYYDGEEFVISHEDAEQELMQTPKEIKKTCSNFHEFIEKYRKNNALFDAYQGAGEPEILPFPKKLPGECYEEFKKKTMEHAKMLRETMARSKVVKEQDNEYYRTNGYIPETPL